MAGFSQDPWPPLGAKWYYGETHAFSPEISFMTMESVGDSIVDGKLCRILVKSSTSCDNRPQVEFIHVNNSGELYFYDSDLPGFQKLLDFEAEIGETWTVKLSRAGETSDSVLYRVDSISSWNVNGMELREFHTTLSYKGPNYGYDHSSSYIERIGDTDFFFPWNLGFCDANFFHGLRCYQDSVIGYYETRIADSCNAVYPNEVPSPQDYIPMDFENGVWIHKGYLKGPVDWYDQLYCDGYLMMDGNKAYRLKKMTMYPKLNGPGYEIYGPSNQGFIYENGDMQVFYKREMEDEFEMIYDFNIGPNDTVDHGEDIFVVNAIDSVEICGRYHRRYMANRYCDFPEQNTITEGVGFSNGLLGTFNVVCGEASYYLYCYTEWGNLECTDCSPIVGKIRNELRSVVYPNPASGSLRIDLARACSECTLVIYDSIGKWVSTYSLNHSNCMEVDVSAYNPGIYFYNIQDNSMGRGAYGKFIVER